MVLVIALGAVLLVWLISTAGEADSEASGKGPAGVVRVTADRKTLAEESTSELTAVPGPGLDRLMSELPSARTVRRGPSKIRMETKLGAVRRSIEDAAAAGGGDVVLEERPVAADTRLPIVKQVLRNNCETAALSMLLAVDRIKVDQLDLQDALPTSGPLDPQPSGSGGLDTWGDPNRGFVGRPDGGGTSGGYGVYEGPIAALAKARGAGSVDLTDQRPRKIYRRLLEGRPVMVWVGLSDGPYKTWGTPEGKEITGNFGEHTVVLTGIDGDSLAVNDPLVGERTVWTRAYFEELWNRLGNRALSL